jgi:hypothetical protein
VGGSENRPDRGARSPAPEHRSGYGGDQGGPRLHDGSSWSASARRRAFADSTDPFDHRTDQPAEQELPADRPVEETASPDAAIPEDVLRHAAQVAEQLALALRTLEERSPRMPAGGRVEGSPGGADPRLQEGAILLDAIRGITHSIPPGEVETLERLLGAWVDRPTDLLILVKLAEQAGRLARVVSAFAEINRILSDD